jgi:chromosome partitioning protein
MRLKSIAVLSLKGGTGKTTSAMHLAACAAAEGLPVTVVDADSEQSASRWAAHAEGLRFDVVEGSRNGLAQQVRALEADKRLVIVDGPPNDREALVRAAMLADVCIVPTLATGVDLDRLAPTLELLRDVEAGRRDRFKTTILFTHWTARKRIAREALETLGRFPVLDSKIRHLVAYEEAFGAPPAYLDEYREAWREVCT